MKLLLIMYGGPTPRRIEALLEAEHVEGYTELAPGRGAGATGRMEGSRAWPGETTVLLTVVPSERAPTLVASLRTHAAQLEPGEHLHVAVLPTETFF